MTITTSVSLSWNLEFLEKCVVFSLNTETFQNKFPLDTNSEQMWSMLNNTEVITLNILRNRLLSDNMTINTYISHRNWLRPQMIGATFQSKSSQTWLLRLLKTVKKENHELTSFRNSWWQSSPLQMISVASSSPFVVGVWTTLADAFLWIKERTESRSNLSGRISATLQIKCNL